MSLLTDLKARKMSPGGPAVPHGGVTGLTLLPSSSQKGHGKWVLRYVSPVSGKRRNAGLGSYPEVGIASVGKLAREMREQIARGLDPLDLRAAEEAKHRTPTFKEAASQMHTELKPGWRNAKHAQQWINTLEQYVFPKIGSVPLDQISPRHIAEVLRPIWLEKATALPMLGDWRDIRPQQSKSIETTSDTPRPRYCVKTLYSSPKAAKSDSTSECGWCLLPCFAQINAKRPRTCRMNSRE